MSIFNTSGTVPAPQLNKFPLSYERLTTAEMGYIYPVFSQYMVPGDFFKVTPNAVIKTAPMFAPIYSSMEVDFHAFVVPLRLLWSGFPEWIYDPSNIDVSPRISMKDAIHIIDASQQVQHSLAFDLGFPNVNVAGSNYSSHDDGKKPVVYEFLAYHKIYWDWFKNELFNTEPDIIKDPSITDYHTWLSLDPSRENYFIDLHRRNYAKDYFTSALDSPQRGSQAILSVLSQTLAPVAFNSANILSPGTYDARFTPNSGVTTLTPQLYDSSNLSAGIFKASVDLSTAAAGMTVSDFRTLFAVQRYLEINEIGGNEYIEGTLSYFGVRVRDARLQRSEYLGQCKFYVNSREVVANMNDATTSMGQRAGNAGGAAMGRDFRYYATEHSIFMIMMSIRPKAYYFQGFPRKFFLNDQFDFPIPLFQHLGEQEVFNHELFFSADKNNDFQTFGYQSRYAEYRSSFDEIRGDFASTLTDWHLGRKFTALPQLDADFIGVNPSGGPYENSGTALNRVFNYNGKTDHLWCSLFFKWVAKRPFKYHTQPMLVG